MLRLAAMILCAIFFPSHSSASTLYGASVTVAGYYPTVSNRQTNFATATVGDGIEFLDTDLVYFEGGTSGALMDLGPSSLRITSTRSGTSVPNGTFDGFIYTFAGAPAILGVSVNPASTIVPSGLTFSGNSIAVNGQGVSHPVGTFFLLHITLAPVPEPSSGTLLLIGGSVVAVLSVRRRAQRTVTREA